MFSFFSFSLEGILPYRKASQRNVNAGGTVPRYQRAEETETWVRAKCMLVLVVFLPFLPVLLPFPSFRTNLQTKGSQEVANEGFL